MKTSKKQIRKKLNGWEAFDYVNIILLTLFLLLVIVPFYQVIVKSLVSRQDWVFSGGAIFFPQRPTWQNYQDVFNSGQVWVGYTNSLIYTGGGVLYSMFLTVTLAYGLSRKGFPGRGLFQNMVLVPMFFTGGLIPFFLVVKELGLIGTRWSVILPLGLNLFNMIIMRTFFEQLPPDLEEAAVIDGAGPFTVFIRIYMPLVKPALATIVLFYAVERWNEWFYSSLFLGDGKLWPIQLVLRQILWASGSFSKMVPDLAGRKVFSEGIQAASVIITMLPIMCVYPFLQRYFVKGVMLGAIKS